MRLFIARNSPPAHQGSPAQPSRHWRYVDLTPEPLQRHAGEIGQALALAEIVMREKKRPEQGFPSCIGIVGLDQTYRPKRWKQIGCLKIWNGRLMGEFPEPRSCCRTRPA